MLAFRCELRAAHAAATKATAVMESQRARRRAARRPAGPPIPHTHTPPLPLPPSIPTPSHPAAKLCFTANTAGRAGPASCRRSRSQPASPVAARSAGIGSYASASRHRRWPLSSQSGVPAELLQIIGQPLAAGPTVGFSLGFWCGEVPPCGYLEMGYIIPLSVQGFRFWSDPL